MLFIGDTEQTSREGWAESHLGDRTDLDLVGQQNDLFNALKALGKPVVAVLVNGRPPSYPTIAEKANAILETWYGGEQQGNAIADALFGRVNPGGKLPVTVVRDVGQVPAFYDHKPSARRGYLFSDITPLYPFGYGLSYTTFEIGAPVLSAADDQAGPRRQRARTGGEHRQSGGRRSGPGLPARRGQHRYPPGQGTRWLPARDAAARRDQNGRNRHPPRQPRAMEPRDETRGRAGSIQHHGRPQFAGPQERHADGGAVSRPLARRGALKLLAGGSASALAVAQAPLAFAKEAAPLYKNPKAPIPARVADLLARMTLAEKIAQIRGVWAGKGGMLSGLEFDPARASTNFPDGIGALGRPSDKRGTPGVGEASGGSRDRWRTPRQTVEFINALQKWALEDTRLGIPVLCHEESLHGYMATDATSFPQAIAMAGTFDPALLRRVHSKIADEMRARGVFYTLSPVVDIVRDPRWGRIEETFGEDPYLVSEMAVATVEGLQGPGKFEDLPRTRSLPRSST